jgi:hypothetical protein
LLNYAEEYAVHSRKVAEHDKDSHAALVSVTSYFLCVSIYFYVVAQDNSLNTATSELRTLFERFADSHTTDIRCSQYVD